MTPRDEKLVSFALIQDKNSVFSVLSVSDASPNVWEELNSDLVIYQSVKTINAAEKKTMLSQKRKGAKNIDDDYKCVRVEAKLRFNEQIARSTRGPRSSFMKPRGEKFVSFALNQNKKLRVLCALRERYVTQC